MSKSQDIMKLEFDETRYIELQRLLEVLINFGILTSEEEITPELLANPEIIMQKLNQIFYNTANLMGVNLNAFSSDLFLFYISLKNESDRGCASFIASFLEKQLEEMLIEYLVNDNRVTNEFLKGKGGLASFEAKIDISYLLGLISSVMRRDLHLLRRIRNNFAHSAEIINFANTSIKDQCSELKFNLLEEELTPRGRFVRVGVTLAGTIRGIRSNLKRVDKMEDPDYSQLDLCELIDEMFNSFNSLASQDK